MLEGQVDVITPEAELEAEIYKKSRCPVCGHVGAAKVADPTKVVVTEEGDEVVVSAPFSGASPLIQGHAQCPGCETEYSAETGVVISQKEPVLTDPNFTDE